MVNGKLFKTQQDGVKKGAKKEHLNGHSHTPPPPNRARSPHIERIQELEEHLAHLSQQKELHTLALKEMYQFLCKLDSTFKAENQRLHDLLVVEQQRSAQLIEVTKGLWEIIEMIDDNRQTTTRHSELLQEVEELTQYDVEISDESGTERPDRSRIDSLMPMVEAAS